MYYNMKTIMGLDISTTTIGAALLSVNEENDSIEYINSEYYKPSKTGSLFERLDETKIAMHDIIKKYSPDIICIEEIIQFMKGGSGAKTIISLTTFNRMVGLLAYEMKNNISPTMYGVLQIRHALRRAMELETLPSKEDLPEIIAKLLKIDFPWEHNKKGKKIIENYDRCDAMCVAYFGALDILGKAKPIKNSKKVNNKNGHKGSI